MAKKARELDDQYHRYIHRELIAVVDSISEDELAKVTIEFEQYLSKSARGLYNNIYFEHGIKHPLIQDQLVAFIRRHKNEMVAMVAMVASYDEWLLEHKITSAG